MDKDLTYQTKFEKLTPWTSEIFQSIKKDLRTDHLLKTPSFVQKYFSKRALDKLTTEEFAQAYMQEIKEGNEELADKVAACWILKHADLYGFFAQQLSAINPQFDEIQSIPAEVSAFLLTTCMERFDPISAYIFCILNAVVLNPEHLENLKGLALAQKENANQENQTEFACVDTLKDHYENALRKLKEKHENKLRGIERKYHQDVDGLKKQIASLHKKLRDERACIG